MTELKSSDEYYRDILKMKSKPRPNVGIGIYRLDDIGLAHIGYKVFHHFDKWTGKYGIKNIKDFEASELVQEIALRERLAQIWDELKDYHHYEGQSIKDIIITKSGMLTAGLYANPSRLKSFLDTSGTTDIGVRFQMHCSDYLKEFAGYDIDYSTEDLVKLRYEELRSNKPEDKTKSIIASLESRYDELSSKPEEKKKLITDLKIEIFEKFAILMSKYTIDSSQRAHQELTEVTNRLNITSEIVDQIIEQGHSEIERIFKKKLLKFFENSKGLAVNIATNDKLKDEPSMIARKLELREILGYLQQSLEEEEVEISKKVNKLVQKIKLEELPDESQEFIKGEDAQIFQKLKTLVLRYELVELTSDLKKAVVQSIIHELAQTKLNLDSCRKLLTDSCIGINRYNRDEGKDFTSLIDSIEDGLERWGESVGVMKSDQDDLRVIGDFYQQYY